MKIAISSTGRGLSDEVDPRFGRAAYLCIYDTAEEKIVEVIDNKEGQQASQGAGITVAGLVASKGVETILTGRVGPKAMAVIDKAGIKVVSGVVGTVEHAVAEVVEQDSKPQTSEPLKPQNVSFAGPTQGQGMGRGGGGGRGRRRGGQGTCAR